ncbi:MAG: YidB family protein [Acidobacteriota bacterium]
MDILKTVTSMMGNSASQSNSPVMAIVQMLANQPGGIGGLVAQFQQSGLGDMIGSWISTGPNPPISHEQVTNVVGADQISELAKKMGVDPATATEHLSELLPQIIDKLSPQGTAPEGNDWMSGAGGLLSSLLK